MAELFHENLACIFLVQAYSSAVLVRTAVVFHTLLVWDRTVVPIVWGMIGNATVAAVTNIIRMVVLPPSRAVFVLCMVPHCYSGCLAPVAELFPVAGVCLQIAG